jgi:hypothetical protein
VSWGEVRVVTPQIKVASILGHSETAADDQFIALDEGLTGCVQRRKVSGVSCDSVLAATSNRLLVPNSCARPVPVRLAQSEASAVRGELQRLFIHLHPGMHIKRPRRSCRYDGSRSPPQFTHLLPQKNHAPSDQAAHNDLKPEIEGQHDRRQQGQPNRQTPRRVGKGSPEN